MYFTNRGSAFFTRFDCLHGLQLCDQELVRVLRLCEQQFGAEVLSRAQPKMHDAREWERISQAGKKHQTPEREAQCCASSGIPPPLLVGPLFTKILELVLQLPLRNAA